jgi:hypothetical protein
MARIDINALKSKFETGDIPVGADYVDLIDTLIQQSTDLGSFGNNEHTVNGIESETIVDSFSATAWRMVKYLVSISKTTNGDNKFYATELTILCDGTDVSVSQYGMIDNDGDIGTVSVSKASGNVRLVVTPNPSIKPVTVRFARMGLKA